MIALPLIFALSASQPVVPVSDHVPSLNVEALCKSTAEIDKATNLSEPQSVASCMRDETAARDQLATIWSSTAPTLRDRCTAEATIGGVQSYVDLLSCIEMTETANASSSTTPLRGASKNRNKQ